MTHDTTHPNSTYEKAIKAFYSRSLKLEEEIGIDLKQAFWALVTIYAAPEFPDPLTCEAYVNCYCE